MPNHQPEKDVPVCLITGASSGIGRAVALQLARRGWRLTLVARRREALDAVAQEATALGAPEPLVLSADIGDLAQARALIAPTLEAFGRLDALVNNAGCGELADIDATTDDILERDFSVNAMGPGALISAAWPVFERQGAGRIVNVSTMGTSSPFPGFFSYAASKAALDLFAKSCAIEGASIGVKAFSVAPGAVETPMLRGIFDESALPTDATLDPDAVARVVVECILGEREEENGATIYLPSPAPTE
ncbi:MAG: SDR family NAD(P)-dependent oxidoreductase [Phycisphaerales bacterium]